jgi:tRNA U55 pseudouridine synthase TruB
VGRDLNVGGRLERLRRTESGHFHVKDSVSVDEIVAGGAPFIKDHLISLPDALSHIPDLQAIPGEVRRLMRGSQATLPRSRFTSNNSAFEQIPRICKIVSGRGGLVILVRPEPQAADISLRPLKVFNTWEED